MLTYQRDRTLARIIKVDLKSDLFTYCIDEAALARAQTLTWDAAARNILAALHGQVVQAGTK